MIEPIPFCMTGTNGTRAQNRNQVIRTQRLMNLRNCGSVPAAVAMRNEPRGDPLAVYLRRPADKQAIGADDEGRR
jgi:hypothetical protein